MTWWVWTIIGVYLLGAVIAWSMVLMMSIDADWRFSEMALAVIWPITLLWRLIFNGAGISQFPDWVRRHWG